MVITVHGVEVDGEFRDAIIQALAMKELPYSVRIHKSKHLEVERWCRQRLGERWSVTGNRQGQWACFWAGREDFAGYNFYFTRQEDLVWVALKWT
jgi:hypothetical protein